MGSSTHLDRKAPERRFIKPHKTCVEEKEMGIIPDGDAKHPGLHVKKGETQKHVKSIATNWARNGSGWGAGLALPFPSFFPWVFQKGAFVSDRFLVARGLIAESLKAFGSSLTR